MDNDLSASSNAKKPRAAFEEMMASAEAGELDVIVAYSNSRFTRRLSELERLIQTHEKTGVLFATVASGNDDLSKADGRMVARIKASVDSAEAERVSERAKRQKLDMATRGQPLPGRYRTFGYSRQYEVIEDEAEIVREIFTRRAAGSSATSIAKDLASRGLTTVTGNPWNSAALLKLIAKPGYAGLREFHGEIIGKTGYPAIIDEPLWRAANGEAAKASPGTNARRWILSGIAVCSLCGGSMTGNGAIDAYRCSPSNGGCSRMRIKTAFLEGPVISLVLARQQSMAPRKAANPTEAFDFAALDKKIEDVKQAYKAGALEIADMTSILADLRTGRRQAEQAAGASSSSMGGPIVGMLDWIRMDVSERRALIARYIRVVNVRTASVTGGSGRQMEPARLEITWTDGTSTVPTLELLASIPSYNTDDHLWTLPEGTPLMTWDVKLKG